MKIVHRFLSIITFLSISSYSYIASKNIKFSQNSILLSSSFMNNFVKLFNGEQSQISQNTQSTAMKSVAFKDEGVSVDEVENILKSYETLEERNEFNLKDIGRGNSNHKSNLRLFDAPDGYIPEITLYRDSSAWCPYCEKVWLYLEEKRIPYKVEKIPLRCYGEKPRSFYQINPSGGLPAAIIKGKTMSESNDIMFEIEEKFKDYKPLLPLKTSNEYNRVEYLLNLEVFIENYLNNNNIFIIIIILMIIARYFFNLY
jgi:glutathione S-transferase